MALRFLLDILIPTSLLLKLRAKAMINYKIIESPPVFSPFFSRGEEIDGFQKAASSLEAIARDVGILKPR